MMVQDKPFRERVSMKVDGHSGIPVDSHTISYTGGVVWLLAAHSITVVDPQTGDVLQSIPVEPTMRSAMPDGESLLIASDIGVWRARFRDGDTIETEIVARTEHPIVSIDKRGDELIALAPDRLLAISGDEVSVLSVLPEFKSGTVVKVREGWNQIWVGTDRGLGRFTDGEWQWFTYAGSGLPRNHITDMKIDGAGLIWIGTTETTAVFNGSDGWYPFWLSSGIPYGSTRCIALGDDGSVWLGTDHGVISLESGTWHVYQGGRWLPGDDVRAICFDFEDGVWVATNGGIAHIHSRWLTLSEKAREIEDIRAARHNRDGWVAHCDFPEPGDFENYVQEVSDNDGLWTATYAAAEAFRFAETGSKEARDFMIQSLKALAFLEDVTPIPGFVARAARRLDETRSRKSGGEWHLSADGLWEWKGDTSSDEIAGHFFGYYVCWKLTHDDELKKMIADKIGKIIDHIIDNGFVLRDVDGERTQWGVWSPELLNRDEYWRYGRGLNSLEILSHLKVAHTVTGNPDYDRIYRKLAIEEHYALNLIEQLIADPAYRVYHDNQLAFLSYYPLLMCEDDPCLCRLYLLSFERTWRYVRPDRSPFWNFIYGAITGKPADIEEGVQTLREIPTDMIRWSSDNSFRWDLAHNPDRPGESIDPVRPAERDVVNWDGNPYKLQSGAGGKRENDGAFWLLAYWMGRYHGFISD